MKLFLPGIFGLILAFTGCTTEPDRNPGDFIIKVDSVNYAGAAAVGDTVTMRLYGFIGPDGCYSFSHFEDNLQPLNLDLTVWGHHAENTACTQVMIYMDGKEFQIPITRMGWFFVNIHQPDGTLLRDSIPIK